MLVVSSLRLLVVDTTMTQTTGPTRFIHRNESCLNHAVGDNNDDDYDAAEEGGGDCDQRGYSIG